MKRFYKLLIIVSIFMFYGIVYAEDEEFDVTNTDAFKETQLYCKGEAWNVKGCYYDRRNQNSKIETITNVKKVISVNPAGYSADSVQIKSASLVKAYTIFNKDKKAIEGLCYRGYVNSAERSWTGTYKYEMVSKKDSEHTIEAFYLTVVGERLGKCNTLPNKNAIVFNTSDGKVPFNYTWKKDGVSIVGYNGYKNGSCPTYFNYMNVSGVAKLTDPELEYTFSDDPKQKHDLSWIGSALSNAITTGSFNGCTDKDDESTKVAIECFNKEISNISNSLTCDQVRNYSKTSANIIKSCTNKSETKGLQSKLLESDNMKEYTDKLNTAISKRSKECMYEKCGIKGDNRAIREVENLIASANCSKGSSGYGWCPNNKVTSQSTSANAKCWMCGTGNDAFYEWSETPSSSCSNSHPESSKTKDECSGTVAYHTCINCIKSTLEGKFGNKGTCIANEILSTQNVIDRSSSDIKEQGDQVVDDNVEESSNQRIDTAQTYKSYSKFDPPEINGGIFGRGGSCSQILGTNGIKILKGVITTVRIVAPIIAIINAMIILLPAVTSKDADGLKKASSKCVKLAVILAVIEIFPSVIKLIGALFGWDTCGI